MQMSLVSLAYGTICGSSRYPVGDSMITNMLVFRSDVVLQRGGCTEEAAKRLTQAALNFADQHVQSLNQTRMQMSPVSLAKGMICVPLRWPVGLSMITKMLVFRNYVLLQQTNCMEEAAKRGARAALNFADQRVQSLD